MNIKLIFSICISFLLFTTAFAQKGIVKGRVFDEKTNEPLPFVNVMVKGSTSGVQTDVDGNYVLTGLTPGFIQLTASFVGYQPAVSREFQVTNANPAYVEIGMKQGEEQLKEVVVKTSVFRRSNESPVSLRSIGLTEIETNPGANRDISKVLQSFPGVGSTPNFRNDIIIRGGGPSESRFYLDGVEIPNINHFATQGASGGPVGIINADFIREVNFYSGAFPASKGNALSGILDFKQINGNKDKVKFRGTVGASELSATLDGPIGKKSNFIFSVRHSYLQFLFKTLGLPFLPTFDDVQFRVRTQIDKKNEIIILGLGALDQFKLNTGIENPNERQQYILSYLPVNNQWSYTLGAVYKHYTSNGYHTFVISNNHLNNSSYKYPDNNESRPKSMDYVSNEGETKLRYENNIEKGDLKLNYGAGTEFANYDNKTVQQMYVGGNPLTINYASTLNFIKYSAFAQITDAFFSNRLTLSLGVRTDFNDYSSSMSNPIEQLSPRFSASYFLTKEFTFNFNVGRYYQLPAYTTLGYKEKDKFVNKDNDLKYINVNHIIAGLEYKPNDISQFTGEVFYKKYGNYPFSVKDQVSLANKGADYGAIGDEAVTSTSNGKAYGFELQARIKTDSKFNFNASYTFVRSEFDNGAGNYIPSAWDSRHILTLTATKAFKNNWNAGLKWRFLGGLPYTPWDMNKSQIVSAWDTQGRPFLDYTQYNSQRFDPFHQLDIRVDKGWFFDRWSLKLYIDIQNFYNFQSQQADIVVRKTNTDGSFVYQDAQKTAYSLKTITNTSGTVLPTIGLQIEF